TGELRRTHQSIFGQMVNVSMCDRCRGEGNIIQDPCVECRGQGVVRVTRTLRVSIPAGIDDNSQIRLAAEGEPGPKGGPAGNLYLLVHVSRIGTSTARATSFWWSCRSTWRRRRSGMSLRSSHWT